MNIDDLTVKQFRELQKLLGSETKQEEEYFFKPGKNYFIRTVTHHHTGKLVWVGKTELVLVDASWIADDGRFGECVGQGKIREAEPFPDGMEVIVGRGAIIDAVEWAHPLPRKVIEAK